MGDLDPSRCLSNGREDLLNRFRLLMAGGAETPAPANELATTTAWFDASLVRWQELAGQLPEGDAGRLPHGHYAVGYQFFDETLAPIRGAELLERLRAGTVRLTGWPPFWVPTRAEIAPYIQDGNIECWLGRAGDDRDAGHADFWRASPQGQFFLIRGYQEDGTRNDRAAPGEIFDLTLPTWRMGEVLLHAASMAQQFEVPEAQVVFIAEWTGLRGRQLANWANPGRLLFEGHAAQQASYRATVSTRANQIRDTLPELVGGLVRSLYELFSFFQLPAALVTEELTRLRERRL
jgi:transcriptional regulator with XRE-family HTH domain